MRALTRRCVLVITAPRRGATSFEFIPICIVLCIRYPIHPVSFYIPPKKTLFYGAFPDFYGRTPPGCGIIYIATPGERRFAAFHPALQNYAPLRGVKCPNSRCVHWQCTLASSRCQLSMDIDIVSASARRYSEFPHIYKSKGKLRKRRNQGLRPRQKRSLH